MARVLKARSIKILDKRTSIRLEPEIWKNIIEISKRENCTVNELFSLIYLRKGKDMPFASAVRIFTILYYKSASTEEGHVNAGHGCFDEMKKRAGIDLDAFSYCFNEAC